MEREKAEKRAEGTREKEAGEKRTFCFIVRLELAQNSFIHNLILPLKSLCLENLKGAFIFRY